MFRVLGAIAVAALLAGCGDGVQRVRISGQVTFKGKPVPYGNITFEPDTSKGNKGPQGYVQIRDGKYDTQDAGTEPTPGPQRIHLIGYPDANSKEAGKTMVVLDYRTTLDLPRKTSTHDFDVPASSARREAVIQQPPP